MSETAETHQDGSSVPAPELPMTTCSLTVIQDPLHPDQSREPMPCQSGQWLIEAVPARCLVGDWIAVDGGQVIERAQWDTYLIVPGAEIILYPRLADTAIKIATGVIFPPLGVYWGLRSAGVPAWASGMLVGGAGFQYYNTIETIVAGFTGRTPAPSFGSAGGRSDLDSSATYGSHGIQTSPVGEGSL